MKEKISLFDEEVTSLGCSFVKGKAALLFADFIFSTEEMRNRLTSLFGKPAKVKDVLLWTDAATSIFLMANENSASLILADTALEQAYIDEEQLANSAEMENAGFRKTLWKKYGDPVGRIGQKTYIVRALLVGIRQQPCLPVHGYALNYLQAMRTSSSYLSWYSAHWVSCRSSVWRYAVFRTSVFPIYTTGDFSAFFLLATRPAPNSLAMSFLPPVSPVCSFLPPLHSLPLSRDRRQKTNTDLYRSNIPIRPAQYKTPTVMDIMGRSFILS